MTKKRFIVFLTTVTTILVLALQACVHESFVDPISGVCDPDSVYYEKDIQPILTTYCVTGCHDEVTAEKGVVLTSYNRLKATTELRGGEPFHSDVYEVIVDSDEEDRMPFNRPALSNENIALVRKWIEQGALHNTCDFDTISVSCGGSQVSYKQEISPILQASGCVGCHGAGSVTLSTYEGVATVATNGRLLGAVTHDPAFLPMPQGGAKVDSCNIENIKAWINQGALNN